MVKRVTMVMAALNGGGVRTRRGFPNEKYIRPESPVATVNVDSAEGEDIVVAAEVFAVRAEDCENTADRAVDALEAAGYSCSTNGCRFNEKMGLFSMRILVRRLPDSELLCAIYLDEAVVTHVKAFSASSVAELYRHTSEEGTTEILRDEKVWTLTLEQMLPADALPEADSQNSFTLTVQHAGGSEVYTDCRWESVSREETVEGIRLTRVAKSWEDRTVSE